MKKLYFGCSLTHASEEFRREMEDFKNTLRHDYEVFDFLGLEKGTERDVFLHDTKCVRECDLFVAEVSHPSTGIGCELGIALTIGKPILAVAKHNAKVARLILGVDAPNYVFKR